MAKADYYDVLGVGQKSSADEIKKAFRKKAMQFHPDRNQGNEKAEQKFKEVNEAYDILKDDQKRAAYDQFGHAAFEGGSGAGGFAGGGAGGGFADIFDEMLGDLTGRSQGSRHSQGADLRYNLEISLDEALEVAVRRTKRFARRQQRWFRRDPRVEWVQHHEINALINEISSQ